MDLILAKFLQTVDYRALDHCSSVAIWFPDIAIHGSTGSTATSSQISDRSN
jgi:hypothetical protein